MVDHLRAVYRSVVAEVRFYDWFYSYQRLLDKRLLDKRLLDKRLLDKR